MKQDKELMREILVIDKRGEFQEGREKPLIVWIGKKEKDFMNVDEEEDFKHKIQLSCSKFLIYNYLNLEYQFKSSLST